jgi:hypothetical protein
VNTPLGRESFFDDRTVRRAAMMHQVPCITTLTGAAAAVSAIRALREQGLGVRALQDYYAADMNGQTFPEEHVSDIMLASLTGVEKLAPKLCVAAQLNGLPMTLTGILPQDEFKTKATWQTASLLQKKHAGCKKVVCGRETESSSPESLSSRRRSPRSGGFAGEGNRRPPAISLFHRRRHLPLSLRPTTTG